jgi:hypothetical protein
LSLLQQQQQQSQQHLLAVGLQQLMMLGMALDMTSNCQQQTLLVVLPAASSPYV